MIRSKRPRTLQYQQIRGRMVFSLDGWNVCVIMLSCFLSLSASCLCQKNSRSSTWVRSAACVVTWWRTTRTWCTKGEWSDPLQQQLGLGDNAAEHPHMAGTHTHTHPLINYSWFVVFPSFADRYQNWCRMLISRMTAGGFEGHMWRCGRPLLSPRRHKPQRNTEMNAVSWCNTSSSDII